MQDEGHASVCRDRACEVVVFPPFPRGDEDVERAPPSGLHQLNCLVKPRVLVYLAITAGSQWRPAPSAQAERRIEGRASAITPPNGAPFDRANSLLYVRRTKNLRFELVPMAHVLST